MTDVLTRTAAAATAAPTPAGGAAFPGTVAADLCLAVAPTTGRFRPCADAGAGVAAGEVLGHVTGGRGRADAVSVPVAGEVAGLLVRPGQLVTRGQALLWLRREAA